MIAARESTSHQASWNGWRPLQVLVGLCTFVTLLLAGLAGSARADEEYVLGPDDVLGVSVWENPQLSRTVVVRVNGTISFPPLGDVMAAGKTTTTLARDLEREIYNNLRRTAQVTISVVAFNSQKVFLAGEVASPGRYSFEKIPEIMDLLAQAGGLGPTADLSGVRIVRRDGDAQRTIPVDISRAVETGDLRGLPGLQRDDLIIVPGGAGAVGGGVGGGLGAGSAYVMGAVGASGPIGVSSNMTLFQALAVAGGLSPVANWNEIEVLAADQSGGTFLMRVDLERELQSGRGGPEIRPGDSIHVPIRDPNVAQVALTALRGTLDASRDLLNLILIRDVLTNNDDENNN